MGLLYLPGPHIKKFIRVDSLSPTPTKKRQSKPSTFHQNRGKLYSLASHRFTKHQNKNNQQLHSQMLRHRSHKYIQTTTVRTSDISTIIPTKITDKTTHNQGHNLGNSNYSQRRIFQGIIGYSSSDNQRKHTRYTQNNSHLH